MSIRPKWKEFLMWVVTTDNQEDLGFHFFHPNPLVKPYSKENFKAGLKESFGSIKFSTGQEVLKKLPKYLPGAVGCLVVGILMMRMKVTSNAEVGMQSTIPVILIVIGVITLVSLFLNITTFDKDRRK